MAGRQTRLDGMAIPQLAVDGGGGGGKVRLGPDPVVRSQDGVTTLRTGDGREVPYPDPVGYRPAG